MIVAVIRLMQTIEIDIWIQSADFSVAEHPKQNLVAALLLYDSTDWIDEIRRQVSLADQHKEFCSPGYGMDHPQGHRLWFCPDVESDCCWGMLTPKLGRRFLGFLSLPDPEITSDSLRVEKLNELITQFYNEDPVDVLKSYFAK